MSAFHWPNTANYFVFYDLPVNFNLNADELKAKFYSYAKQYHPDFFTLDAQAQSKALEISALNNKAFKVLNNAIGRFQYILELKNSAISENSSLPQAFLMEMMDLNEEIDALDFEENKTEMALGLQNKIKKMQDAIYAQLPILAETEQWEIAKESILKWRYLERLQERVLLNI